LLVVAEVPVGIEVSWNLLAFGRLTSSAIGDCKLSVKNCSMRRDMNHSFEYLRSAIEVCVLRSERGDEKGTRGD
jgi:hypothetical protein